MRVCLVAPIIFSLTSAGLQIASFVDQILFVAFLHELSTLHFLVPLCVLCGLCYSCCCPAVWDGCFHVARVCMVHVFVMRAACELCCVWRVSYHVSLCCVFDR